MLRTNTIDSDNPYTLEERIMNIVEALAEEGYGTDVYTILTVPNITHITYGRDVGYTIRQEHLGEEIESISATEIRRNK